MNPEPDALLVALEAPKAYLHVRGRGSFKMAGTLKKFGGLAQEKGCAQLVIDMSECLGMDSTFMGVLAGLAMRLRKEAHGEVVMVNLGPKNHALLATLGLDRLLRLVEPGAGEAAGLVPETSFARLDVQPVDKRTQAQTMVDAHEDLVRFSPANLAKFKDVLAFLKEDLQRSGKDSDERTG